MPEDMTNGPDRIRTFSALQHDDGVLINLDVFEVRVWWMGVGVLVFVSLSITWSMLCEEVINSFYALHFVLSN